MTTDPISTCLSAINALDAAMFASPFTPHGTLTDEGRMHTGLAEIKKWAQESLVDHRASVVELQRFDLERKAVGEGGGEKKVVVRVSMDGDFQESHGIVDPFELWMSFKFERDGRVITDLLIEPKRPERV